MLFRSAVVLDLSPGFGLWALAAVRMRIPYLGACLTPTHVDYLYAQITSRTLAAMIDANDEIHDGSLANLISEPPGTTPNTADADDNGSGAMAKAMPKGPPQPA